MTSSGKGAHTPSRPSVIRAARFPANAKKDFLSQLWNATDPLTVFSIGQSVDQVSYDPIWGLALQSRSPARLFEGWKRFEQYAHSSNRVRFVKQSKNSIECARYSLSDTPPTKIENHLICGIFVALLSRIGCTGLKCTSPDARGRWHVVARDDGPQKIINEKDFSIEEWRISWRDQSLTEASPPAEIPFIFGLKAENSTARHIAIKTAQVIVTDISRSWKISDIASETGLSSRSLQRRLTEAGVSFSALIRSLRIHTACQLLQNPDLLITIVSFSAGFSDCAQFSRDFRLSMGMTPSEYRLISQSNN